MSSHHLCLAVLDALPLECALAWSSRHSCSSLLDDRGHFQQDDTSVQAGHEGTKCPACVQAAQEHKGRQRYTGTDTQKHRSTKEAGERRFLAWIAGTNTSGGWPCLCCVPQHSRQH